MQKLDADTVLERKHTHFFHCFPYCKFFNHHESLISDFDSKYTYNK